jgi:hypothetical protein
LHPPRWRAKSIVVGVLRWHYYKAHLEFLEKTLGRCMLVDYNALRADSQQELMRVCEFLGIAFEPIMLQEQFERNTSFKGNDRPAVLFSRTEQWFIRGSRLAATMIPHFAMRMIHNWLKRRHKRQPFPVWFFDVERNDSLTE